MSEPLRAAVERCPDYAAEDCGCTCHEVDPPAAHTLDLDSPETRMVCALCLFVGESRDPEPVTILNGQLTCEPHSGYFQGGDHGSALGAWREQHRSKGGPG